MSKSKIIVSTILLRSKILYLSTIAAILLYVTRDYRGAGKETFNTNKGFSSCQHTAACQDQSSSTLKGQFPAEHTFQILQRYRDSILLEMKKFHPPFVLLTPLSNLDNGWEHVNYFAAEKEYIEEAAVIFAMLDIDISSFSRFQGHCEVIDVGANVGYVSLLASVMGCQVYSVEAHPKTADFFEASIHLNEFENSIRLFRGAVSRSFSGNLSFTYELNGIYNHALKPGEAVLKGVKAVEIPILQKLSILVPSRGIQLIKIDVEGFEYDALLSVEGLLRLNHVNFIIFEWVPGRMRKRAINDDPENFIKLVLKNDYSLHYTNQTKILDMRALVEDGVAVNLILAIHKRVDRKFFKRHADWTSKLMKILFSN